MYSIHVHCACVLQPYTGSNIHIFNPFPGSDSQARCAAQLAQVNAELSKARSESAALLSQVQALTAEKKVWLCVCVHVFSSISFSILCSHCLCTSDTWEKQLETYKSNPEAATFQRKIAALRETWTHDLQRSRLKLYQLSYRGSSELASLVSRPFERGLGMRLRTGFSSNLQHKIRCLNLSNRQSL